MNSDSNKNAMSAPFLSDQDLSQVQSILANHGLSGFDASVRLWGRGKAIDVRGTLGQQELSCLLAIARFLGNESGSESANEQRADADSAPDTPPPAAMRVTASAGMPAA